MPVIRNRLLRMVFALSLLFIPLVLLIRPDHLYILMGAVLCTTSIEVVHAYWPSLRVVLRAPANSMGYPDYLTIGILMVFSFTAFREGYTAYAQVFAPLSVGRSMEFYLPLAIARYGSIIAAYMSLAARHFFFGPRLLNNIYGWPRAILSMVVGLVIGLVLVLVYVPPPITD